MTKEEAQTAQQLMSADENLEMDGPSFELRP
jgi:hypothetical protein